MKLSEAKEIVANISFWHFKHMGIEQDCKPITASLEDMIRANKMVERSNKKALARMNKHKPVTMQVTLDERLIAATFVAMTFQAHHHTSAESIAEYQGKFVYVIHNGLSEFNPEKEDD